VRRRDADHRTGDGSRPANNTFTVQSVAKRKAREVTIHVKSDMKIVRFTRAPDEVVHER
jgi:hypothetical protein